MSTTRIGLTVVLLVIGFGVTTWVSHGYEHTIRPPARPLEELPSNLGDWHGEELPDLDERTVGVLGADSTLGRRYTNPKTNESVSLHFAIWSTEMDIPDPAPHPPQACYTGVGFEIQGSQTLGPDDFNDEGDVLGENFQAELVRYEQAGKSVATLHWFQIGPDVFTDKSDGRSVHQSLWGVSEWPSTLKVLIHIDDARNLEMAKRTISGFVPLVYAWTSKLDQAPAAEKESVQVAQP